MYIRYRKTARAMPHKFNEDRPRRLYCLSIEMTEEMATWVTTRSRSIGISKAEYIRALISNAKAKATAEENDNAKNID